MFSLWRENDVPPNCGRLHQEPWSFEIFKCLLTMTMINLQPSCTNIHTHNTHTHTETAYSFLLVHSNQAKHLSPWTQSLKFVIVQQVFHFFLLFVPEKASDSVSDEAWQSLWLFHNQQLYPNPVPEQNGVFLVFMCHETISYARIKTIFFSITLGYLFSFSLLLI